MGDFEYLGRSLLVDLLVALLIQRPIGSILSEFTEILTNSPF